MDSFVQVLVQFAHAPSLLILLSSIRTGVAVYFRSSVQSSVVFKFLCTNGIHVLTVAIWQCYFANVLASANSFVRSWKFLKSNQRILSLSMLVPAIVFAPYFVTNGLLKFTHGLPPTGHMHVFNLLPAVLWTIPFVLNSALGLFQAANGEQLRLVHQMRQMQEVFMVYLVNFTLYYVFLKSSDGDALVGSNGVTTAGIVAVALVGFALQSLYMWIHGPHGWWNENMQQGQLDMADFGQPQAGAVVETEEQSTLASELALPPMHQISTEYRPVTLPCHKLPRITRRESIPTVQAPRLQYQTVVEIFIQIAQFVHHTPGFLMLFAIIRTVVAIQYQPSVQSSIVLHMLTVVMWQYYFANTLTSIKCFQQSWELFTFQQRFFSLGMLIPAIVFTPNFVTNGLLELTHGLPPSVPMHVFNLLPAVLWTIPVILNSALGLFQAANGEKLRLVHQQQMQEVFMVYLVNLILYCVMLKCSDGDNLVGSSEISAFVILAVALVGFVLQFLYMWPHRLSSGHIEQEHVTPPPEVSPNGKMVAHSDRPVPPRRIPDAVCRF